MTPAGCVTPLIVVRVLVLRHGYRHQVQVAVTDASPGDELVGELPDPAQRSAKYACLKAVIVVEMDMQRGHRKIMMIVLCIRELPGQVALVMIVDIGQNADASNVGILVGTLSGQEPSQQVAYGLGSAAVAQPLPVALECFGQLPIQGYGESLGHDMISGADSLHYARPRKAFSARPAFDAGQKPRV
tara:strand:- start:1620 stop:2180 length:561 start_codon:yes stop_codon:yes gene_type:complete